MSLLFNMLSIFVITFLPRGKCPLISWLQLKSEVIFEPKKIKSVTVSSSPSIFQEVSLYAEYIIQNARLDEAQAGIKTAERNINNFRNAHDTTLMAETEELKSLLMKVKQKREQLA